jgi:hypothetical protein
VGETKPIQTKNKNEQKAKARKKNKCLKGENGEDYYVKRTSWLLVPRTVTKKRKKRSSGSCTWELRKSKESCKHRLP